MRKDGSGVDIESDSEIECAGESFREVAKDGTVWVEQTAGNSRGRAQYNERNLRAHIIYQGKYENSIEQFTVFDLHRNVA